MKKRFSEFIALVIAALCICACIGCGDNGGNNKPDDDSGGGASKPVERELLPDPTMKEGIYVSGLNSQTVSRTVWKYGNANAAKDPLWFLGQYCDLSSTRANYRSDYNDLSIAGLFDDVDDVKKGIEGTSGNGYTLTNYSGSKYIAVNPDTGAVTLSVDTRKEYCRQDTGDIAPRKNGEDWVHMILSPDPAINEIVYPATAQSFVMSVDFTIDKCNVYDSSIGADQFQWIFTAYDRTSELGEYFWFILSLYDNRYESFPGTQMFDSGKADATGQFMYAPSSADLYGASGGKKVEIGQKSHVELDLKEHMRKAFESAQAHGAMPNSKWENISVHGFNIGWEVSNVSEASVTIENMSLKVTTA